MLKSIIAAYKRWRLRRAMEAHAYWKGKREQAVNHLNFDCNFRLNPHNHNCAIKYAAKEAQLAERVDFYLHNP